MSCPRPRRLRRLETLFQRGARYVTLAHFYKNDAAVHGFGVRADQRTGLSPFGRDVVAAMNDIGLVVDLAHVGEQCALDACYASRAPVMVTHTGLRGFEPTRTDKYVTRNITDELLVEVRHVGLHGGREGQGPAEAVRVQRPQGNGQGDIQVDPLKGLPGSGFLHSGSEGNEEVIGLEDITTNGNTSSPNI